LLNYHIFVYFAGKSRWKVCIWILDHIVQRIYHTFRAQALNYLLNGTFNNSGDLKKQELSLTQQIDIH